MGKATPAIRNVKARAVVTPLARPVKNAFGVIDVAPLLLIDVATDQGITALLSVRLQQVDAETVRASGR